ncbi:MAG: hypothetical protein Fur0010_20960 [Bdellovibrio sp.]
MELDLSHFRELCEKLTSREVDLLLGFDIRAIERTLLDSALKISPDADISGLGRALHDGNQTWIGLDERILCTSYKEIFKMFDLIGLESHHVVVDLGAAYGRMGIVMNSLRPSARYLGLEYVPERVEEGNRVFEKHHCLNAELIEQDLFAKNFEMPEADIYFLYEYGRIDHIKHTLDQVQKKGRNRKIKLIARGDSTISMINYYHPWLAHVYRPHHDEFFSIYSNFQDVV